MASMETYFSVLALFILFRETIEASIICSVLLQFLNRSKPALKKTVWYGVAAGVGVSIIFGVIFIAIYYTARDNLFAGKNRSWFKGVISWIAALLITILGFAMLRFLGWEAKWKRKLAAAMAVKVPEFVSEPTKGADGATAATATVEADEPMSVRQSSPAPSPMSPLVQHQSSQLTSPTLATTSSTSTSTDVKKSATAVTDAGNAKKQRAATGDDTDVEVAAKAGAAAAATSSSDDTESGVDQLALPPGVSLPDLDAVDTSPPTRKENMNIFILVFTTVVREGIESVVFLGGLANVKLTAIPLPAFVGILCGCLVGIFLYYSGKQVKDIKWLVIIMGVVIFFIAAGQVNLGTDALMNAGAFGYSSPWMDERPWYMVPIYDWSKCCSDVDPKGTEPADQQNRQRFFSLMRAIFGYQDKGTPVEIISYCCYWGLVLIIMAWKAWRGTLLDADYKYTRQQRKLKEEEEERAAADAAGAAAMEGGRVNATTSAVAVESWGTALGGAEGGAAGRLKTAGAWLRGCSHCGWRPKCFGRRQ